MGKDRKLRILVAKPGLDGHDRGARVIARAFRDSGFEVIYTGCHQTPEQIVNTAIQEDVDLIGLSILSGAHTYSFPRIMELLKESNAEDIRVIGGGIFPLEDIPKLKGIGIREIFEPGAKLKDITDWVEQNISPRKAVAFEGK
ncbi:MAG: cobalamin B12-binding domain-containing protein [Desulfobacteraceae bacterium]|nr:cobalamin B12-binding domain-containing protein [Desulfobacteraceae bacterium]